MIMADVFKILFLILGMLIGVVSYWLLFSALFAQSVARTQHALLERPWRVFMSGAVVGVPLVLLGVALAANGAGPLKLLGIVILMGLTLVALFGSTGLVRQVGMGLGNSQPLRSNGGLVMRGGTVVAIACVLPMVGWFFVIPVVLITGFGAALPLLRRTAPQAVATQPEAAQA